MNKISRIILALIIVSVSFLGLWNTKYVEASTTLVLFGSSSDRTVQKSDVVYLTARNATTGTFSTVVGASYLLAGQLLSGGFYGIYRSSIYFDTSTIPAAATIYSANLQIGGVTDVSATDFDITITNGMPTYPHDPMVTTDYDIANLTGTPPTDGGHLTTAGFIIGGYNTINLNATGLTWINKGGQTKFMLLSSRDINSNVPVGNEYVVFSSADGALPVKLTVNYTSNPSITCDAATVVTATGATLNSTVVDDGGTAGGVSVRWGYGTTSHIAADFLNYDIVSSLWTGGYSTGGTPFTNVTTLLPNTTYYYRIQAKNQLGISITSTTEQSFTTLVDTPAINSMPPSIIAVVSAQLNALVTYDGGEACEVSWGYGTTSHTAVDFALYDTVTAFAGAYATDDAPLYSATGLDSNTTYYYRVQIKNATATVTSTDEQTFTTLDILGDVTNFNGDPSTTSITLAWTQASASSQTEVYYKTSPYASADPNIVLNASFETNDPPDDWTLVGAGASVARSNVQAKYDTYSALVTRAGADCYIYQNYTDFLDLASDTIVFGCWIYTDDGNADTAKISLYDGHTSTSSSYHTAAVGWQWITVTKTIDAAPTELSIRCHVDNNNVGVYFDWATIWLPDGTRIYNGTSNSYTHTGLTVGTTYYYLAFGSSGTLYSTTGTLLTLTTSGIAATVVSGGGTLPNPTLPSNFGSNSVDSTKLNKLEPFYSIIGGFATSWGMPTDTMWVIGILIIIAIIGIIVLVESQSVFAALITIMALMIGSILMSLLPAWMFAIVLLIAVGSWATRQDFG